MTMIFPDQNSTNFLISVKTNLSKLKYNKKEFLRYHQYIVYNYVIHNKDSRGVLMFHEMGFGKSITATALAEYYREHDPERKIVVLLSKSLQANFKKNIAKYIKKSVSDGVKSNMRGLTGIDHNLSESEIDTIIDKKYKFVSLNASNMYSQVTRMDKTKEDIVLEKQLQEFTNVVEKDDFLENTLLIIDEYHNLANSITNGSYNAIRLYDTIMRTKNIKLIFLTGTPIVNNPFELAPTFNMLKGYIPADVSGKIKIPLFPELKKDFYEFFVDLKKNRIKNKNRLENRIVGMVSYYGNLYFGKQKQDGFPEEKTIKIERVPMSSEQFAAYDEARDSEREEASFKGRRPALAERFASKGSASSSYRVKSRQISNFLIPDMALTHKGRKVIKHINIISKSYIKNLSIASPKFAKIISNIAKHKNQLGLFYSEFVSGEGIALFAKALDQHGFKSWNYDAKVKDAVDAFGLDFTKSKKEGGVKENTYAIISGDVDFETRARIVREFNAKDNIRGQKISLLLISKTGAEGLDLKNLRHIHICEPYWNMARIDQIIARGVRYLSHEALPKKDQNVQPYVYLSDYPTSYPKKKIKEMTTDVDLYTESLKNKILINQFYTALAEASIDCTMHEKNFSKETKKLVRCRMCSPNNKSLYNNVLRKDLAMADPCEELKQEKIIAKEIDVDGTKYYYTITNNQKHIFRYDDRVNGYIPLQPHEEPYGTIMQKLL